MPAWSALRSIASDSRLLELLVEFAELLELPSVRPVLRVDEACLLSGAPRAIAADQYTG